MDPIFVESKGAQRKAHQRANETGKPQAVILSRGYYYVVPRSEWNRSGAWYAGYPARMIKIMHPFGIVESPKGSTRDPMKHPLFPRTVVYLHRNSPKNFSVKVMVQRSYGERWAQEARVDDIANSTEARAVGRAFIKTFQDLYGKEVERSGW